MSVSAPSNRPKALDLETYLNEYLSLCRENQVRVLLSVRKALESSISNGCGSFNQDLNDPKYLNQMYLIGLFQKSFC